MECQGVVSVVVCVEAICRHDGFSDSRAESDILGRMIVLDVRCPD